MPSIAALRHAPWSISKIRSALHCPLQFRFRYVDRIPEPEVAPDARIGKAVHVALEGTLTGRPLADALALGRRGLLHDEERARYDELAGGVRRFAERIDGFRRRRRVRTELVEHRLAFTADLRPAGFLAPDAFFRGVWDAGFVFDDGTLAVVDHKTGQRRIVGEYADQLEAYAVLAAPHLAHVRRVWLGVHFVADAAIEWWPPVTLDEVRSAFAPRLAVHVEEAAAAVADGYAPRPNPWCPRCAYRSICPSMRGGGPAVPDVDVGVAGGGAR